MITSKEAKEKTLAVISARKNKPLPQNITDGIENSINAAIEQGLDAVYIHLDKQDIQEYQYAILYFMANHGYTSSINSDTLFISWSTEGRYGN